MRTCCRIGEYPKPKAYHTATVDEENGMMYVFGGYPHFRGSAYAFLLIDGVEDDAGGTVGKWFRLANVEYKRSKHTANIIESSIYLFGGKKEDTEYNDLNKYDIKNKTFQEVKTTGKIPSERYNHGSAVIDDNLYIFGGEGEDTWHDSTLYSLNTIPSEWVTIPFDESSGSWP